MNRRFRVLIKAKNGVLWNRLTAAVAALRLLTSLSLSHVFLTGEIHSDWREVIATGVADKKLPVTLTSPNTSHEDSDDCGAIILGMQEERPNWDKIGANMNSVRTQTLLKEADVVVVRFGEKYRQWVSSILLSLQRMRKDCPLNTHFPLQTLYFRMLPLMLDTRRPWENQSLRFTHRRSHTC